MKTIKRLSILIFCGLIATLLYACGTLAPPDDSEIRLDLYDYYNSIKYDVRDSSFASALELTVGLRAMESFEILEQEVDSDNKVAHLICTVTMVSADKTFSQTDLWDLSYIYSKQDKKKWTLAEKECLDTQYALRTDVSEDTCEFLLHKWVQESAIVDSVVTDRDSKTACVAYSYQIISGTFGEYGSILTDAKGTAQLIWNPKNGGWTIEDFELNDSTEYLCNLSCHLHCGDRMLPSEQFSLDFDLQIVDNAASIKNVEYQGNIRTLGNLDISDVKFQANDAGTQATITFTFSRDVNNIEQDKNYWDLEVYKQFYRFTSGEGTIYFGQTDNGACFADISLPNFIATDGNSWEDYRSGTTISPIPQTLNSDSLEDPNSPEQ